LFAQSVHGEEDSDPGVVESKFPLRANIDETVPLVVITEHGEKGINVKNEEQW
jgi:hypothetical protein